MNLRYQFLSTDVASDWYLCHFVDVCHCLLAINLFYLVFANAYSSLACKSATIDFTLVTDSHGVEFSTGYLLELNFALDWDRNRNTWNPKFAV
jgi:hypothetical protein